MTHSVTHPRALAQPDGGAVTPTTLTYDDWCAFYAPVKNPVSPYAAFDGTMFETFGDDLAYVQTQPLENIWTLVQGNFDEDGGNLYVINGYYLINRIGYFVTRQPMEEDEDLEIPID